MPASQRLTLSFLIRRGRALFLIALTCLLVSALAIEEAKNAELTIATLVVVAVPHSQDTPPPPATSHATTAMERYSPPLPSYSKQDTMLTTPRGLSKSAATAAKLSTRQPMLQRAMLPMQSRSGSFPTRPTRRRTPELASALGHAMVLFSQYSANRAPPDRR